MRKTALAILLILLIASSASARIWVQKNPQIRGDAWWRVLSNSDEWEWVDASPSGQEVWLYETTSVRRNQGEGGFGSLRAWYFVATDKGVDVGSQISRFIFDCRKGRVMVADYFTMDARGKPVEDGHKELLVWTAIQPSTFSAKMFLIACPH